MAHTIDQSPWLDLKPIFVLPEDFAAIINNKNYSNLHLDTLPEQVIGGIDRAKVVFLLLNPGFSDTDITTNMALPGLLEANRNNLIDPYGSPFYYFGSGFEQTGGYKWWSRILNPLIKEGISKSILYEKIMAIEYFPYHSKNWKNMPQVPSQQYAYNLVKEAINRKKIIIIMRSKNLWFKEVPSLVSYEHKHVIKNPRNPVMSSANLGYENFNSIISILAEE